MKEPSKERQLKEHNSQLLTNYTRYTPDKLREVADQMEEREVQYLELDTHFEYGDTYLRCQEYRLETEKEADKRYKEELKRFNDSKDWQERQIKQLATELGYKLTK